MEKKDLDLFDILSNIKDEKIVENTNEDTKKILKEKNKDKTKYNIRQNERNKLMRKKVNNVKEKLTKDIGKILQKNIEDIKGLSKRYKKININLKSEKDFKTYVYEITLKELRK